jgi:hypothetical protein
MIAFLAFFFNFALGGDLLTAISTQWYEGQYESFFHK